MHLLWTEVALAVLRGELDRAEVLAGQLGTAAWRVRRFTAEFTHATVLSQVLAEQGRTDEALRAFEPLNHPPYDGSAKWFTAWLLADAGRLDEAAVSLGGWDGPVPADWLTLTVLSAGVLAASAEGDQAFLRRHLPALEPLSGCLAIIGNGGSFFGPVDFALASAREALGDLEGARDAAASAAALADRVGAVLWLRRINDLQARLGRR
jgi:hypothetical protein